MKHRKKQHKTQRHPYGEELTSPAHFEFLNNLAAVFFGHGYNLQREKYPVLYRRRFIFSKSFHHQIRWSRMARPRRVCTRCAVGGQAVSQERRRLRERLKADRELKNRTRRIEGL
jgi:hypothetical protein